MEKYEIEYLHNREWFCQAHISMLTGYPLAEVLEHTGEQKALRASEYKKTFRALGYNCSATFRPFDAASPYPVLLRTLGPVPPPKHSQRTGKLMPQPPPWYAYVYYDNLIYDTRNEGAIYSLEDFKELFPNERITSMIQVWVSDQPESIVRTSHFY